MDVLKLGTPNNFWNAPTYSVKVRGLRYLWGSAGLTKDLQFEKAFILHVANDLAGQPVKIGTRVAAGTKTDLGEIQPGECLSLSVNAISGVYAESALDSVVHCLIY
jgi:hypothetical protein